MGTLVWIAAGFTTACVIGVYVAPGIWLIPMGIFCVTALVAAYFLKTSAGRRTATVLLGCLLGILWLGIFDCTYLRPALKLDGSAQTLRVELSDFSYETDYGTAAEGRTELSGRTYRIKIYLNEEALLSPGDVVTGTFELRYTADGGSRSPTYHQGNGIFLLGYPRGNAVVYTAEHPSLHLYPAVIARKITELLDSIFPEDTLGFARALLLGDDRLLDYETDMALKISGIRHVIAVSGLHVSVLFGFVYQICGKRRVLTAVFGIPILVLFAAVAGFTPSIIRACVMQSLMILAMLLNREYDPLSALAFSVLLILGSNPLAITSISFQLSAASMVGISLFSAPLQRFLSERDHVLKGKMGGILKRWGVGSISVALSAMVMTTPLCAYYFNMVSIVGVLTNLLTMWVVTFIFCGIVLACGLGALYLPLGLGIAWALSWPMRYVLMISNVLSRLPLAAVYTNSLYIIAWLVFCYVLLIVFQRQRKKHPGFLAGCMALGLLAALACTYLENQYEGFSVSVIDVGQGQCILLQTEEESYLVDCGNTRGQQAANVAIGELFTRGVFKLDGVILTHYDKDHSAGINGVLRWIKTDTLYLPDVDEETEYRREILARNGDIAAWVQDVVVLPVENGTLTIYPPSTTDDSNESSLCVLFQVEEYDILITGDRGIGGEEELLRMTQLPKLELLVAGHHGSRNSTGLELLMQTQPKTVAISVGADNTYGHPAQETLERLELFGCTVLRTDLIGTITFRG